MSDKNLSSAVVSALLASESKTAVARRLGVSESTLYRWASGAVEIKWRSFEELCSSCGKDALQLLQEVAVDVQLPAQLLSAKLNDVAQFLASLPGALQRFIELLEVRNPPLPSADSPSNTSSAEPKIFEYSTFGSFFSDYMRWRRAQDPRFSYRRLRRQLRLESVSTLSMIASGARQPSPLLLSQLALTFKMSAPEVECAKLLLRLERETDYQFRELFQERLDRLRGDLSASRQNEILS